MSTESSKSGNSSPQKSLDESIESRVSTTSKEDKEEIKGVSQKTSDAITNKTPTQRKRRGADNAEREVAPPSVVVSPSAKRSSGIKSDDEPPEYEVEAVVDKKSGKKKAIEYQVKWKGYKELSWEPLKNLHCADLIRAYEDSVKSSRLKSFPTPKRASVHVAEKFSPKHVAPVKVAAIKKRSHSVARKTPVLKTANHVLQQSFCEQTAEEIFGALVVKNLSALSPEVSANAQIEIMKVINEAKQESA
uniref:Chromo domain-containing protein n=1 Tax=Ditylenchus dipsaci TaxID=166011 RepID=A0A915EF29_9BILA